MFFDRDGVLNEAVVRDGKPYPPASIDDLRITPGAPGALAKLKDRGFLLLVVTNQPDVARGRQTRENVDAMNRRLRDALPLDDAFTCFHDDADNCDCRKPRSGLITRAAEQYGIDLAGSYLVGDRWRDIDAGRNAGCRTILIDHGYTDRTPAQPPDARVKSLTEAADWILAKREALV
ncbi:MAG TPA: HAD family hydrolase [Terriglobia bacterium]|nr:HAD family hydrolase [Terriglobia bacterium]